MNPTFKFILLIAITIGGALFLRYPTINYGMPYFYDEDEAHHFNRTMNMVKSGDLNPHYFHKPSLHFYLRIPVVYAAYIWGKQHGYLEKLEEVRTYNRFGIADYAFTASHPSFVKWNRAWSLLLSLLLILLTILIAKVITNSNLAAILSGIFCSVSPALLEYSSVIGVDVLMSVMCLISVYFSLLTTKKYSFSLILLSSFFAGLAVSSKYNAAPIGAAPLIALLLSRQLSLRNIVKVFCISCFSFFLASPYILISFNEFLSDLKYELWHYGVAGHVGHMAEPGLQQVLFYSNWFSESAIGLAVSILALLGILTLLIRDYRKFIALLAFPFLFFVLMIAQKANFVRNMLVLIPFLCILSAYFIEASLKVFRKNRAFYSSTLLAVLLVCLYQPITQSLALHQEYSKTKDSRNDASSWLIENNTEPKQVALSGYLQLPPSLLRSKNFTTVNQDKLSPLTAYILGYDKVVYHGDFFTDRSPYLKIDKFFAGIQEMERIVKNPAISVISFVEPIPYENLSITLETCSSCNLLFRKTAEDTFTCSKIQESAESQEDYCWATSRYFNVTLPEESKLAIGESTAKLSMEVMSAWPNQVINLMDPNGEKISQFVIDTAGKWYNFSFDQPNYLSRTKGNIIFSISKVASPAKESGTSDVRRLGLAIKNLIIYN